MFPAKLSTALTLIGVTVLGGVALAQSDASAESEPKDSKKVEYVEVRTPYAPESNTIATKLAVPIERTPANVGTVSRALMLEQGAFTLSDALQNVSGIGVEAGSGVFDYFVVRGFGSLDGAMVLTDGAAEPEATFYPVYNVDGVEVLKGPAGFLYGSFPLAGAVNLIRKQPLPTDLLDLRVTGGSFATAEGRLDWNVAGAGARPDFRFNGTWKESDNYRDDMDSEHYAANPSFSWRLDDGSKLNLNLEYFNAEYQPDSGLPLLFNPLDPTDVRIPNVSRENSYQSPLDFSDQEVVRLQFDFETDVSDNVKLRSKIFMRQLDWTSDGTLLVGSSPLAPDFALRTFSTLDDDQLQYGNQLEAVIDLSHGRVRHQLLVGLETSYYDDDFNFGVAIPCGSPTQFGPAMPPFCIQPISILNPVEFSTQINAFPFLAGDEERTVIAPYFVDQIEFSERFQLMIGARYDDVDQDVVFRDNQQQAGLSSFSRNLGEWSPMGGVIFQASDDLTLYANAGQSFALFGARVLNADTLDPEESTQYEVGVRKRFLEGKLRTTFSAYRIDRDNIPITDQNGFTQQAGDQRSEGLEIELAAEPLPRLHTFFSYAYNDAELQRFSEAIQVGPLPSDILVVDRSGNLPAFAPEHLVNLWVSRSFGERFGVSGGLRFVDDQFIDEDNVFQVDSYALLDAAVSYDMEPYRFQLNFKNLTDEDYMRRGFGGTSVIPGNPFTVFATVEYRR